MSLAADIGCGSGFLSLILSKYADRIIATDISPKALALTKFNAVLNGIENIETRLGSVFEPLGGDKPDLIVSNPPFVISPPGAAALTYRSSGEPGDSLTAHLVTHAAKHLAAGGTALALINWENKNSLDFSDRPAEMLRQAATRQSYCAAWVIERENILPAEYAAMWVRDGGVLPHSEQGQLLIESYLKDFTARGVRSISMGVLRLKATQADCPESTLGAPIVRIERVTAGYSQNLAAELTLTFDNAVQLAQFDDNTLLRQHLLVRDTVLEQRIHNPGSEQAQQLNLILEAPFARHLNSDTLALAALGACDGELTVGQISDALAQIFAEDPLNTRTEVCAALRELAWSGALTVLNGNDPRK